MDAFGINIETARRLVLGGMGDLQVLRQVEVEDLSDTLGDETLAKHVFERIQSYNPTLGE